MMKREYFPALRGRLGDWAFYSVLMTLNQVAARIKYAKEIHNSVKLSNLIQRELDEKTRAGEIGEYLVTNNDRFFNSLVVAVYDGDPEWHEFQNLKPVSDDIKLSDVAYNSRYSVGYLSLSGAEKLFALDGQHRLAGIRNALKQNQELGEDEVSVIFVAHHTDINGLQRTRKLFTTLNKTAKPVSKSEIIALDEADAMAITARELVENDARFNDKLVHVMSKQTSLPKTDTEHLITLINLYDLLETLFTKSKKGLKAGDFKRIRPSDEQLQDYFQIASQYFNLLESSFVELRSCFNADDPTTEIHKYRHDHGGHVLFRPVGLLMFTEVAASLMRTAGLDMSSAVAELKTLPTNLSEAPYTGVLWDSSTGTLSIKNRALIRDILIHYLGYIKDAKRIKKLRDRYCLLLGENSAELPERKSQEMH